MSSNGFDATLDLAPAPSGRAQGALVAVHVAALLGVLAAADPGPAMALLALAVGASWLSLRRHSAFGHGPRAVVHLLWREDGSWRIGDGAGRRFEAELQGDTLVHPRMIILNFELAGGGRRTRILLGDELPPGPWRRLLARLRLLRATPQ